MAESTTVRRVTRGGVPGWLDDETGRWLPIMAGAEGDGDGDSDTSGGDDGSADADDDGAASKGPEGDADGDAGGADDESRGSREPDWKREARKHERRAKQNARELDELRAKLKEREDADKSEQERAIEEARRQAREEALREAEKERRSDRLETAVIRLASKGVRVGDDTKRFDDPEDALVFIERAIHRGDLDADDVFDDRGRVKADVVEEELANLLERKPRLAAGDIDAGRRRRDPGDIDAGKGKGAGRSVDELSVEELYKRKASA
jgi:hypothetical protein